MKQVSGDVFGRIYEYFLTPFADQKAHDGGEFFTPISIVSLIAHVLDPDRGTVLDPACGSGGMLLQSARTVEEHGESPTERLTFRGLEKNATTICLAKMNLAVHGLEGDIQQAITYYEDPHELVGKADYVMANPPFNVDEIDADKVKTDPRLPFGLPGVNKTDKVTNGNYVWISYFYSYLNERGRAGFVMSSQASSAGGGEAKVRRKLVETGDVAVMIAIRSNFFYTRTVPCELWFFNRAKPEEHRDKVLMIDARSKVPRKIYDFSPEQEKNLLAIVWLFRGETQRFLDLVEGYCRRTLDEAEACFRGEASEPLLDFSASLESLRGALEPFLSKLAADAPHAELRKDLDDALTTFESDVDNFEKSVAATGGIPEPRGRQRRTEAIGERSHCSCRDEPGSRQADRPSPPDRDVRDRVRRQGERRLGKSRHHQCPQACRRGTTARRRAAQAGALLLAASALARRAISRSEAVRCEGTGQARGSPRDRSQRLESDPRPLRGCRARGRG